MKYFKLSLVVAVAMAITALGSQASAQNLFANPGFEDPVTSDGPPFVGFWEAVSGNFQGIGGSASSANGSVMPRTGDQHLDLNIVMDNAAFAGAFQDVSVSAGNIYTFSGWHKLLSGNSGGTEIRIEWRSSTPLPDGVEISRTMNLVVPTSSDYTQFSLTATAPVGADLARAVYAIQSFSGVGDQNVLVDDTSFTCIPEPASVALLGVAGVALVGMRRRTA